MNRGESQIPPEWMNRGIPECSMFAPEDHITGGMIGGIIFAVIVLMLILSGLALFWIYYAPARTDARIRKIEAKTQLAKAHAADPRFSSAPIDQLRKLQAEVDVIKGYFSGVDAFTPLPGLDR